PSILINETFSAPSAAAHASERAKHVNAVFIPILTQTITSPGDLQPRNSTSLGGHAFKLKEEPDSNSGERKIFLWTRTQSRTSAEKGRGGRRFGFSGGH